MIGVICLLQLNEAKKIFFDFVGYLDFTDGENSDPVRVLKRALNCAGEADILFEDY